MSNYKCTKCGKTAWSKCIGRRSVFPSGGPALTTLSNAMVYRNLAGYTNTYVPCLSIALWGAAVPLTRNGEPIEGAEQSTRTMEQRAREEVAALEMLEWIREVTVEELKQALCDCIWEMTSDECELGCCKRKEASEG